MKKVLIRIFSAVLIVACFVGLTFGGMNINSILDTKDFWENVKAQALESFDAADAGIAQLKENEEIYKEGVDTAEAGKKALDEGGAQLAVNQPLFHENEVALKEGHATYEQKYAQYQAALKQLEEGKKTLAEGEKVLAENKQAYEEGKATLARVQPLYNICMGHYNAYQNKLAEYNAAVEAGEAIKAAALKIQVDAMKATYEAGVDGMTMQDIVAQYDAGMAQIQAYEEGMRVAEEGRAQIAAGEAAAAEAEKQLAAAKAMLDEKDVLLEQARNQLNSGIMSYEKGQNDLLDGLKKLSEFEGGQDQIAEGLRTIIDTETYFNAKGEPIVMSIADRLGSDYNFYKLDENGDILVLNGEEAVDLDKAAEVVRVGREFVDDTEAAVTHECMGRAYATIFLLLASLAGIAAGILGLIGKGTVAGITSCVSAVLAAAGLIADVAMNPLGYSLSELAQCSNPGLAKVGIILVLLAAVACAVMGFIAGNKKTAKAPKAAAVEAAPAAVAAAESEALMVAKAEVEKAKAEAEKARADAESAKAELELYRLKIAEKETATV